MKLRLLFLLFAFFFIAPAAHAAVLPTCSMSAVPSMVTKGGSFTLKWSSNNATSANIPGPSLGNVGASGQANLIPIRSTRYTGTFTGPGGKATCQATVTVVLPGGGNTVLLDADDPLYFDEPDEIDAPGTFGAPAPLEQAPALGPAPTLGPGQQMQLSNKEGTGLIPCTGINCQACDLATLAQKIINFLIGLSIPLAAAMFAYAGVIYFTSGVVDKIEKAKKIFTSVLIGFALVAGGWLIVQTILSTILSSSYKNWNQIQCVDAGARKTNESITTLLNSISILNKLDTSAQAPVVSSFNDRFTGGSSGPVPSCAGEGYTYSSGTGNCYNPETGESTSPTYTYSNTAGNSAAGTAQWTQQLSEACSNSGLDSDNCLLAQAIMANESSGRSGVISSAGAVGLMQVLPTTACSTDSSIAGCGSCQSRADNTNGNCSTAAQALLEPSLNMRMGTREIANLGQRFNFDPALVAAGYNGGAGANRASNTCQGSTVWQCSVNSGYAETRNYVPKVLNTFNTLKK